MIRKIILAIITVGAMMGMVTMPAYAATCPTDTARAGEEVSSLALCNLDQTEADSTKLWSTVNGIINVILAVLGIAAVFMVILGGISILTSQGDPSKVKKGKDTILYGIIGLIVAMLAFAIVNFILGGIFA